MVKFRQKYYAAPAVAAAAAGGGMGLMNALTAGSLGLGVLQMGQASKQSKQAEEQQQEALRAQQRENARLTKSLDKLAKAAEANPMAATQAAQAGHLVGKSKAFAVPAVSRGLSGFGKKLATNAKSFAKNAKSFGKEAIGAVGTKGGENGTGIGKVGKTMIGMATTGVITAGAAYAVDKGITADARKIGMMPEKSEKQRSYAMPAATSSVMSKAGTYLKKGTKYAFSKKNLLNKDHLFMGAFAAFPAAGYLGQRAQFKSQMKNQDNQGNSTPGSNVIQQQTSSYQQKSYAAPTTFLKSTMSNVAAKGKGLFKNWDGMKTITGGAARLSSFNMYGKREIQAYGQRLAKGNHAWSKKTGKWIQENPNKANLAGAVIGAGAVKASWTGAEDLTKKALNKVDKDAYAYEKHQNQEVK